MEVVAHYFFGTKLLGTGGFSVPVVGPGSSAYFCLTCGEVWARIVCNGVGWEVLKVPCPKHKPSSVTDWREVPGSFLCGYKVVSDFMSVMDWPKALDKMPPEILRREFDLHMNWFASEGAIQGELI